jgi:hypothetical protein
MEMKDSGINTLDDEKRRLLATTAMIGMNITTTGVLLMKALIKAADKYTPTKAM